MIPPGVAIGVNRIITKFVDAGGWKKTVNGTGFWLDGHPEGTRLFVTNRHLVDPRLDPETPHAKAQTISIELRSDPDADDVQVRQFEILDPHRSLFVSDEADCAVFAAPKLDGVADPFSVATVGGDYELASDRHDVWRWLTIGDLATFIGFAGTATSCWWDRKRSIPIGRQASLASHPGLPFEHEDIRTADAGLVSGLSFSGASGSPLISHVKVDVSDGFSGHYDNRVDSAIIGIMSGHFWDLDEKAPELFRHSGLSYFTRAPSIHALVERARACEFVNTVAHPFLVGTDA